MTVRWRDPAQPGLAHRSLVGLLAEVTLRPSARRLSSACWTGLRRAVLAPGIDRRRVHTTLCLRDDYRTTLQLSKTLSPCYGLSTLLRRCASYV